MRASRLHSICAWLLLGRVSGFSAGAPLRVQAFRQCPPRQALCCATPEAEEREKARKRRDNEALQSEWREGLSENADDRDDEMRALRERIDLIETKEEQLAEIKDMLRTMGAGLGLELVKAGEITAAAWVFVGLNVLAALYAFNVLLVAPLTNSLALLSGSGAGQLGF